MTIFLYEEGATSVLECNSARCPFPSETEILHIMMILLRSAMGGLRICCDVDSLVASMRPCTMAFTGLEGSNTFRYSPAVSNRP